jgi:hypothetical protein
MEKSLFFGKKSDENPEKASRPLYSHLQLLLLLYYTLTVTTNGSAAGWTVDQ